MQIFLPPIGSPAGSRQKKIRNVALTREEYTAFATIAGRVAKQRLDHIVRDAATTLIGKRLGDADQVGSMPASLLRARSLSAACSMRNSWHTSTKLRLVSALKAAISAWICCKILAVASAAAIRFIRAGGPTTVVAAADNGKVA